MPREVTDMCGISRSYIQAFAGLTNDPEKVDAARGDRDEGSSKSSAPQAAARSPSGLDSRELGGGSIRRGCNRAHQLKRDVRRPTLELFKPGQ
jgi:hypothetical protein